MADANWNNNNDLPLLLCASAEEKIPVSLTVTRGPISEDLREYVDGVTANLQTAGLETNPQSVRRRLGDLLGQYPDRITSSVPLVLAAQIAAAKENLAVPDILMNFEKQQQDKKKSRCEKEWLARHPCRRQLGW